MITTKTVNLEQFKNAVGFTLARSRWGNRRATSMAKVKTTDDVQQDEKTKERMRLTKMLIEAEEYDKIVQFQEGLRRWILERTVPSFFRDGFQLTKLEGVEVIESRMRKAQDELSILVDALIEIYPIKVEEARSVLGAHFSESDYPDEDRLRKTFSLSWNWIAFTVPEGLPLELRQAEQDKLERQFADAGQQITHALRLAFQKLIAHAADVLATPAGEKPKVFRDSVVGNIAEFINTFNQRNLMNDAELAQLVTQAKEILVDATPQKMREQMDTKKSVADQFAAINAKLATMVIEPPSRTFELEEEPAEVAP